MTAKIFGTLFAALFSPIALLVFAAALIVMAPIVPFYIVFYVVRKELRPRRERERCNEVARAYIRTRVAMHRNAASRPNPTNN